MKGEGLEGCRNWRACVRIAQKPPVEREIAGDDMRRIVDLVRARVPALNYTLDEKGHSNRIPAASEVWTTTPPMARHTEADSTSSNHENHRFDRRRFDGWRWRLH
jgi:hypothetical protein